MSIHVQLERFEGPLGLLLHLIREQEMDIFNINIHEITRQYLEYIKTMRRLDLEVAGEFVAMAATLLHIKSRMLLPQYNEEGEEVSEDPRKELVQKLVEYKRIRELSVDLYKRPLLGRDVFTRGERTNVEALDEGELVLAENPLFSLISAYRTAVRNMKKTVHRVAGELQSIAARILEMKDFLVVGRRVVFRELITAKENVGSQVLVTFLSLLELAKMGFVSVFQTEPFADIHIESKQAIDNAAVSRAENYESVNAAAKADEIMHEAQLTLDEPVAELEGEEGPVVGEGYADAASDDDIAAEEIRLFAENSTPVDGAAINAVVDVVHTAADESVTEIAAVDIGVAQQVIESETLSAPEAVVETASLEVVAADESVAQQVDSVPEELAALTQSFALGPEPAEAAPAAVEAALKVVTEQSDLEATASLDTIPLPATEEPVEAAVTDEPKEPAKSRPSPADIAFLTAPDETDVVKEKLNSAMSAALSAFDAFKDDPEVKS
ncbi:MAG: segregation/condensation protein A [Bdellovibrionales bacterium]|nr:segregation/condensation protein A [Bdellovibrionales bacterium]